MTIFPGWKFLKHNKRCCELTRILLDHLSQQFGVCRALNITRIIKVSFTGHTSDHHRLHKHKSWPKFSNKVHRTSDVRTHTRQDVLFDTEKWLDGRNASPRVPQDEIQILEFGMDRLVYKVIVAMVFMLRCECMLPMRVASQLMA